MVPVPTRRARRGYNVPPALRLTGRLNHEALRQAFTDVVERREVLRTGYLEVDGEPCQQVREGERARPLFTVRRSDPARLAADLDAAAREVFDLATELPVRCWLFVLGESDRVLLVLSHHIASDGLSIGPLTSDLDFLGDPDDPDSLQARQSRYWTSALAGRRPNWSCATTVRARRCRPTGPAPSSYGWTRSSRGGF